MNDKTSGDYLAWLLESLQSREEIIAYLEASIEAFKEDADVEALLLTLRNASYALIDYKPTRGK